MKMNAHQNTTKTIEIWNLRKQDLKISDKKLRELSVNFIVAPSSSKCKFYKNWLFQPLGRICLDVAFNGIDRPDIGRAKSSASTLNNSVKNSSGNVEMYPDRLVLLLFESTP